MTTKIAFANTLKPIDDVRTYEKLAKTIAKTNKYEVNIIGNKGKKDTKISSIIQYPNPIKRRWISERLQVRWKTLSILLKISPAIVIVGTHELLAISFILKLIKGSKIIYDVRENYKKNILFLSSIPPPLSHILACGIRVKEWLSQLYVSEYWLAEKCYLEELKFTTRKSQVIENSAVVPVVSNRAKPKFQLLFSGSISRYSDPLSAVNIHQQIRAIQSEATLKVIGQCHEKKLRGELENRLSSATEFSLEISSDPVCHEQILEEINKSTLGIISYEENPVNRDKIPTKLFEYSRHRLPFLVQEKTNWAAIGLQLGGAIPIDFMTPDLDFIFDQLENKELLFPNSYPEAATWEAQQPQIVNSISTLVNT